MLENKEEILEILEDIIISNNLAIKNMDENELKRFLKNDDVLENLVNYISKKVFEQNKEKRDNSYEMIKKKIKNITIFKKYKNLEKLIGYMYYEYNISYESFIILIKEILKEESPIVLDDLTKENIIIFKDNMISLSQTGIEIAIILGYSIDDVSKESFISNIKQKIKK